MRESVGIVSLNVFDVASPLIVLLMLVLAFATFTYNRLFEYLLGLAHFQLPLSGMYLYAAIAIIFIPLAFLRIWNNSLLSIVTYLSWAFYLPSVLYYCGIDPFKIIAFTYDFGFFATALTPIAVTAAGIALACGSLMARSFTHMRSARDNFIGRGADKKEVYRTLYRNAFYEIRVVLATAAAILLIILGVQAELQNVLVVLRTASFVYLLAGLCAVVILALVFLVYLWPRKRSEKG